MIFPCRKVAESSPNRGRSYRFKLDRLALLAQKKYAKETNASTKSDLVKNKSEVKKIYLKIVAKILEFFQETSECEIK